MAGIASIVVLKWLGGLFVLGCLGLAYTFWFVCPCEVVPGGSLAGEKHSAEVEDWSFVNDVGLCQVEVDAGIAWSINLNCMASAGELFVSCSRCADKTWSQAALRNDQGFVRVADTVYPIRLSRVTAIEDLDRAWAARASKLDRDQTASRPDHWWSFQLTSR